MKRLLFVVMLIGCATAPKAPVTPGTETHGVASWYGQEYAGRTTANGEIFDPMLFTAAHRSLPFGTVVDVQNAKTHQSVRVRINDRGPYIGGRMIDLSYAAAQQIGLIEPGSGEVDLTVIKVGKGDREPPAPYVVTVPDVPVIVDKVQVVEQHPGVETRLQVSPDGRKLEEVPTGAPPAPAAPAPRSADRLKAAPTPKARFVVQVGAFALEANAKQLLSQLSQIGQRAYIDGGSLYRVRIGPFDTREQAIQARARLETAGLSAIVVAP